MSLHIRYSLQICFLHSIMYRITNFIFFISSDCACQQEGWVGFLIVLYVQSHAIYSWKFFLFVFKPLQRSFHSAADLCSFGLGVNLYILLLRETTGTSPYRCHICPAKVHAGLRSFEAIYVIINSKAFFFAIYVIFNSPEWRPRKHSTGT